ncbi:MAG TPA: CGNR zinc finger domain-containing protein [Acidimicrobiales bacterium]|nr:CGNR zinc finger domain-containing protein [Acidimicrobiales bacterium]
MDFDSYAHLAVDLVSSEPDAFDPDDPLADVERFRAWLGDARWWMRDRARTADLAPLAALRTRLRTVFDAAGAGDSTEVVARLNDLLDRHTPRPSVSGHGDADWHLHVASAEGPLADEYAAGAVMGLTMAFLDLGRERLGVCADDRCRGVFLDTSRNRSRRYCSDRCATRANVAALRRRRAATDPGVAT